MVVDLVLADPPSSVSLTTATTLLSLSLSLSSCLSLLLSIPPSSSSSLFLSLSFCTEEYLNLSLLSFFCFPSFSLLFLSICSYTSSSPLSLPLIASRSPFFF